MSFMTHEEDVILVDLVETLMLNVQGRSRETSLNQDLRNITRLQANLFYFHEIVWTANICSQHISALHQYVLIIT
jgi:hypothetical protein